MNALLVFAGGGLGSLLRFGIGQAGMFFGWGKSLFPWSTLLANVLACLFMALLVGLDQEGINAKSRMFGMIGFCGGLSTFSTLTGKPSVASRGCLGVFGAEHIIEYCGLFGHFLPLPAFTYP